MRHMHGSLEAMGLSLEAMGLSLEAMGLSLEAMGLESDQPDAGTHRCGAGLCRRRLRLTATLPCCACWAGHSWLCSRASCCSRHQVGALWVQLLNVNANSRAPDTN